MTSLSFGSLAQSFLLQRRGVSLRTQLNDLSKELASQQVSDVRKVLDGNVSYLADIERDIRTSDSYKVAASEAQQFVSAAQIALEKIQKQSGEFADSLLSVSDTPTETLVPVNANEARNRLDSIISSLNSDIAGRSLFSGTATKEAALRSADVLLTALDAELAGAATPAAARAAAQTWFDDPAGFEATMYTGSSDQLQPFRVAEGEELSFNVNALDQRLKDAIMDMAVAALADSNSMTLTSGQRTVLLQETGFSLKAGQDDLIGLRGQVGTLEARAETVIARNSASKTALDLAKRELLSVDPFETATKLEDVRFRLESIYTVTGRLADLALVNFIR